jgi:hypothetical protein
MWMATSGKPFDASSGIRSSMGCMGGMRQSGLSLP